MGSEDFGIFGSEPRIPYEIFWLGATDPQQFAEDKGIDADLYLLQ